MNIEILKNISHQRKEIARSVFLYGAVLPLIYGVGIPLIVCHEIYVGVRGRFDRDFRERAIQELIGGAYRGVNYSGLPTLLLWPNEDRHRVREGVREISQRFDAMTDLEMTRYAGSVAAGIREATRPIKEAKNNVN